MTGYLGGAIGAGAGLGLGTAFASLLVPEVGTIFALGLGAATLLGVGGATVGAWIGEGIETEADQGVAKDDVQCYRQLLRLGRSLVVVKVESEESADRARVTMQSQDGERFEDARRELQRGPRTAAQGSRIRAKLTAGGNLTM